MPLVDMKDMLAHAYQHKYAVGAFDLVSLDFLEAIVQGAENRRAPIVLSLAESHFEYFDFELALAGHRCRGAACARSGRHPPGSRPVARFRSARHQARLQRRDGRCLDVPSHCKYRNHARCGRDGAWLRGTGRG